MNYLISDLLDGLENAGQPITPAGGSAARVKKRTLARLRTASEGTGFDAKAARLGTEEPEILSARLTVEEARPARRRFRPLAALAAALAAVLLLSGGVFAAWKLGAFRFTDEFGPAGRVLDDYAQTWAPSDPAQSQIVSAQWRPAEREADYVPQRVFSTAAETRDFRFSLRTLSANASVIYAVMDVEGLTDYGRTHLDVIPELAVTNHSRQNSGTLIDARLVGSGENLRRYLFGNSGSRPLNEAGDVINFEILELFEEAYPQGHSVYLFDVVLESLVPGAVTLEAAGDGSAWKYVYADALSLILEAPASAGITGCPTVELVFRDGARETVLWEGLRPGAELTAAHQAVLADFRGWKDDSVQMNLVLASPLDLEDLAEVVVDGTAFAASE